MNEPETRTAYILPSLTKAGWGIVSGSRIREEFPITKGRLIGHGKTAKPDKADYVLQYRNRNLAIIEAKLITAHYTEGVGQAKDYAEKLQIRFTYSTNGLKIYGMDMQTGIEGDVTFYPTPDELWQKLFGEETHNAPEKEKLKEKLYAVPFETKSGLKPPRYYQENAINNVSDAIAENKNRILLTLATGTGKTAIAFQIAWRLYKAKWNLRGDGQRSPRILFLADRNILADQAFSSFNEYGAFQEDALVRIKPTEIKKIKKAAKNGNVFFTIFQTFLTGPDDTPYFGAYEKDFFDFIIIDECHRGGANDESTWRVILEHFSPAVQLGLTDTPKRTQNTDTYKYFGDPVYIYSLNQGINDGFLTPFKIKEISTTGDDYIYTSDDEIIEGAIEKGKTYTLTEQNRVIELMDIERYRVETFMNMIDQSQKTLVFCATQAHALAVRNLINQIVKIKNPNYCHRVTADDGKLGEQHLKEFQDNEKSIPTILTTSQKLSTGVDAPEIRNIVLLRPIKQLIEYKQIIGRGTRLFDGKDYFTIYDFFKAYANFKDLDWDGPPLEIISDDKIIKEPNAYLITNDLTTANDPEIERKEMIRVKLSDGKIRELQYMTRTSFWSPDGKPISAEEFLQNMYGTLPALFKDENELRELWSRPATRKILLEALSEKGFAKAQLEEFQKVLNAENSDLYDVLAYVAFHSKIVERTTRAENAKIHFKNYDTKQQAFLNFVLSKYISSGVYELDEEKLWPLLHLKYNAMQDAKKDLGNVEAIRNTFIGFQTYLYENKMAV